MATANDERSLQLTIGGDLTINRMGFGAMRVTGLGVWGPPPDKPHCLQVLRTAIERGVNFIDTADSYGPGTSEEMIAEALYPYPAGLVIATKGGLVRPAASRWERDGRPEHLRRACEGSLQRLRLERIDLYQLHAVDRRVPLEESVTTLADLQKEGKIRHVGLSNVSVDEIERARRIVPIVSVQNQYSLDHRVWEDVLAHCGRNRLAFLPWYPLGSGRLTDDPRLAQAARRLGATPAQVALAWLLDHADVTVLIPGTSKLEHLEENLGAAKLRLSPEERTALAPG